MNSNAAPKFTVTQTGHTYTVRDAAGDLIALATFAPASTIAGCQAVMRERAEFLRRFV